MLKQGAGVRAATIKFRKSLNRLCGTSFTKKKRPPGMTNIQKIRLIEETLEREIKPLNSKKTAAVLNLLILSIIRFL